MRVRRSSGLINAACLLAFVVSYVTVVVTSLLPTKALPQLSLWDKAEHFIAYGVLALLGGAAIANLRLLAVTLAVTGVAIELLQGVMGLGRQADVLDIVANLLGVGVGSLAVSWLERVQDRHRGRSSQAR